MHKVQRQTSIIRIFNWNKSCLFEVGKGIFSQNVMWIKLLSREKKIKTRLKLKKVDLSPFPFYPFSKICGYFANVVQLLIVKNFWWSLLSRRSGFDANHIKLLSTSKVHSHFVTQRRGLLSNFIIFYLVIAPTSFSAGSLPALNYLWKKVISLHY